MKIQEWITEPSKTLRHADPLRAALIEIDDAERVLDTKPTDLEIIGKAKLTIERAKKRAAIYQEIFKPEPSQPRRNPRAMKPNNQVAPATESKGV